jgi:hypothetical protein
MGLAGRLGWSAWLVGGERRLNQSAEVNGLLTTFVYDGDGRCLLMP